MTHSRGASVSNVAHLGQSNAAALRWLAIPDEHPRPRPNRRPSAPLSGLLGYLKEAGGGGRVKPGTR